MNNNFFTTAASNEVPQIKEKLEQLGYTELEPTGTNHLFVDKINKTFWECDENGINQNIKLAENTHKETPIQLTLKEVALWQN
ncbi:hypothetical protein [Flavobacterium mekongense]|uniref:hypothetical protein n=1 Tax=Flavobacterium mekongense TaxID=3379707 RepID=UPI0039997F3D